MAKLGLPDENFWNQKQQGALPKANLSQPFGDTGTRDPNQTRFGLGDLLSKKAGGKPTAGTAFQSAVNTVPERDLPMYNMRFDGQSPINLASPVNSQPVQQQPETFNPNMTAQGNGQMRLNLGDNGNGGQNFIQSGNKAGMERVAAGLKERGGLSMGQPTQSAEAQAAGTTDFWLNHNKADEFKANLANRANAQNQNAQIQNLMQMALTQPHGGMSPSEFNAASRQQKAAMQILQQMFGAQENQQALGQRREEVAANKAVGLAGARAEGANNQMRNQIDWAKLGLDAEKANQDQYMPVTLKDYQDGMVTGERIVPFNKRNPTQALGGMQQQPQQTPEYQAAFAAFKQKYPNASDEDIHAAMAAK